MSPGSMLSSNLLQLGERMRDLFHQAVAQAKVEVGDIIQSDDRDTARIEHQLDHMLGFCCDPDMLLAFKRLCRHYFTFAPEAAAGYVVAYREIWDVPQESGTPVIRGKWTRCADSAEAGGAGV